MELFIIIYVKNIKNNTNDIKHFIVIYPFF